MRPPPRSSQTSPSARIAALLLLLVVPRVVWAEAPTAGPGPHDAGGLAPLCPLVEHERERALQDSQFELELLRNEYAARKKVFAMIEQLWQARSIEREVYLDSKRLRDRTHASIARVETQIAQETSIAKQYALTCARIRGESVDRLEERVRELQAEYRRLDCELLARDLAIARIDRAFDEAMLEATLSLVNGNIKSRYELVIDEYDLSQSNARVESYRAREALCRKQLPR